MVVKKVLVAMVVLALFAAGCGGSSDSEELAQVRAELDALRQQSATTAAPPTTTRAPQRVSGPYGVTADDEYMVECMLTGAEFMEFISALAFTAGSSTSHSELGLYFVLAQDELLGDRAAMTATMFLCEGAYPRLFQSTISTIGDWIDACSQVSSYSATSTDERCMRLTDSASAQLSSMTGRINEVAEFIG